MCVFVAFEGCHRALIQVEGSVLCPEQGMDYPGRCLSGCRGLNKTEQTKTT